MGGRDRGVFLNSKWLSQVVQVTFTVRKMYTLISYLLFNYAIPQIIPSN